MTINNIGVLGIITGVILFTSCGASEGNQSRKEKQDTSSLLPVFLFDSIIYYSIRIPEDTLWGIERIKDKNKEQRLLIEVLLYEKLDTLADTTMLTILPTLGFNKRFLSKDKCSKINSVLQSCNMASIENPVCVPVFRDILIFRKNGKNTGIMKLCFDCKTHTLDGEQTKTNNLTSIGWKRLRNILDF